MNADNYSHLTNEQLNHLIHTLSKQSRDRYAISEEGGQEIDRRLQALDELVRESEALGLYTSNTNEKPSVR